MKKVISMFTVLVLCLLLCVPAFAAETKSNLTALSESVLDAGSVQVTDATSTDSFDAFEIMTIDYNDTTNDLSYKWNTNFTTFLASADNPLSLSVNTTAGYQVLSNDSDEVKAIMGAYAAYCRNNSIAPAFTLTGSTAKIDTPLGQYVLAGYSTATTGARVYQVMSVSYPVSQNATTGAYEVHTTVALTSKATTPSVNKLVRKNVNDTPVDAVTAQIGEDVIFTITATVPKYSPDSINNSFVLKDTLDGGLTFKGDITDADDIIVKASTSMASPYTYDVSLTLGTHYTVSAETGTTFVLTFDYDEIKGYTGIQVEYTATVNSNAVVTTGNKNTAVLHYSDDPYNHTASDPLSTTNDDATVYTYELDLTKVDNDNIEVTLAGAQFTLSEGNTPITVSEVTANTDGFYKVDPNGTATITSGAKGKVVIIGLDAGVYTLTETKAANGYSRPTTPWTFTLTDAEPDGKLDQVPLTDTTDDGIYEDIIKNAAIGTNLPETGGEGALLFVMIGVGIALVGFICFFVIRKKAKKTLG